MARGNKVKIKNYRKVSQRNDTRQEFQLDKDDHLLDKPENIALLNEDKEKEKEQEKEVRLA